MSTRMRLANDPYVRTLEKRTKLAHDWFDAIAKALWEDLEEFKKNGGNPQFVLDTLELKLTGDAPPPAPGAKRSHRAELTLFTHCSQVRVVANDPTGWIYLEVVKNSPIFQGVLHRGAIELALIPHGGHDEAHLIECDWLNPDGSEVLNSGQAIASKLWDVLFLPKIRHQLAAAQKGAGH